MKRLRFLCSWTQIDILARTADNRRIAIENQYTAADHDHFTRGLAYAVNLQASALVIIAEGHGDEFITLADHLNRSAEILGDEGIPIFLVTLKVDEVGSNILPRFEVIAKPNKWRAEFITSEGNMAIESANRNASNRRGEFGFIPTHVRQILQSLILQIGRLHKEVQYSSQQRYQKVISSFT